MYYPAKIRSCWHHIKSYITSISFLQDSLGLMGLIKYFSLWGNMTNKSTTKLILQLSVAKLKQGNDIKSCLWCFISGSMSHVNYIQDIKGKHVFESHVFGDVFCPLSRHWNWIYNRVKWVFQMQVYLFIQTFIHEKRNMWNGQLGILECPLIAQTVHNRNDCRREINRIVHGVTSSKDRMTSLCFS